MYLSFRYMNNPFVINRYCVPAYNFCRPVRPGFIAAPIPFVPFTTGFMPGLQLGLFSSLMFMSTLMPLAFQNTPKNIFSQPRRFESTPQNEPLDYKKMPSSSSLTNAGDDNAKIKTPSNQKSSADSNIKNNSKKLGPEFLNRVKEIANNINCNYKDILALLNSESGLESTAVNRQTGATGLLQFMPKTAYELGTTTEKLLRMSPVEQLNYVEKYFKMVKKYAGFSSNQKLSSGDLYALTLLPKYAKNEVLTEKGRLSYKQNKGLDINKDGKITKTELSKRIENKKVDESIFSK